jgi:hypothetical protein
MVTPEPDARRRARARVLLAACTLALGIGAGLALALPAVLAKPDPALTVSVPGSVTAQLKADRYVFSVSGTDLPLEDSRPVCTSLRLEASGERVPVVVRTQNGREFATMHITTPGEHQITCSSPVEELTVSVGHAPPSSGPRLLQTGLLTMALTALAVLLAARPLLFLRRRE